MRIRLLGAFGVSVGPRTIAADAWRLKNARRLVALLALARGHRMHREQIMDTLWPRLDPKAAANNLHRALHFARGALSPTPTQPSTSHLRLRGGVVELRADAGLWVDVEAFEESAAAARHSRTPAAYQVAADLYAGELLPEDRYEEWAEGRRAALRQTFHSLLVEMAASYEARGDFDPAIPALERVVADDPVHQDAGLGLMRLYALAGRRNEAIDQYGRLARSLARGPETEPGRETRRLYGEILAGRFPAAGSRGGRPLADHGAHNLPVPRTTFVGREGELVEAKRALAMTRLLTLTGAGGSGKTRLALEVARDLVGVYADGVWLVELAPLTDPALVPRAVAAALDVPEQAGRPPEGALSDHLKTRTSLLILDNCEHVVDAAAGLADALLSDCPSLRILATSREPLEIPGETVLTVPPLTLPEDGGTPTVEALMRSGAVRLFVDRARSRLPDFELTAGNAAATGRVCRKLDGIPLAIELACARMGALAVHQVARRLDDSLGLLTGGPRTADPRQRTMRATLKWSHDLLSEPEKELFARLSVFAGGWTLGAAEAVSYGGAVRRSDVLDLLSRLVDKSLVLADGRTGEEARYRMLEPVRQYGRNRLEENREVERTRDRHAAHYLAIAEKAEVGLLGRDQLEWLGRLTTEHPNLRAALSWCLDEGDANTPEGRPETGLRLATALGRFWGNLGSSEGRGWLEKGLARSGAAPASLRARALSEAGWIAVFHFDRSAIGMIEEALALYKELGDRTGQASTINHLMHAVGLLNYIERAPTLQQETLALLEEPLDDPRAAAFLHLTMGMISMFTPDHEQVVARMERALALFEEVGDAWGSVRCLSPMGIAALGRGDVEYAAWANKQALQLLRHLKNKIGTSTVLIQAAGVAVLRNRPARGARLFAAAQAVRRSIGHPDPVLKPLRYDYEALISRTRDELGDDAFEAAFSEGLSMSDGEAIEYALSAGEPAASVDASGRDAGGSSPGLTRRELEIAHLVGRGLSNRQIASELSISEHTVAAHVRKILKKLGLRSRAQIPAP